MAFLDARYEMRDARKTVVNLASRISYLASICILLSSCTNFFGDKTKLDFIVPPDNSDRQVSYVPILPEIRGFQRPTRIIAGNDQLLYVVDSSAEQLVCLDESGRELSRLRVPGITNITQDRTLDLLATGRDTVSIRTGSGTERTVFNLACIFRINLKNTVYGLREARIINRVFHRIYGRLNVVPNVEDQRVIFQGIAVLPDNQYLVTRTGPGIDVVTRTPDDAVLLFTPTDGFATTINISGSNGASFSDFFRKPFAIATVAARSNFINSPSDSRDFLVTTLDATQDTILKIKYIEVDATLDGTTYGVKQLPLVAPPGVPGFFYQPGRFKSPKGVAVATDETNYIFVTDRDSLLQFSPDGYEGVKLRASRVNQNYNKVSFGGTGNGPYQFNQPSGIAYLNRVVYVADAGNGRIVRFKLTTDFE